MLVAHSKNVYCIIHGWMATLCLFVIVVLQSVGAQECRVEALRAEPNTD